MKRFLKWLGKYLVRDQKRRRPSVPVSQTQKIVVRPPNQRPASPATAVRKSTAAPAPAKVGGTTRQGAHIEDLGPGKNVLVGRQLDEESSELDGMLNLVEGSATVAGNDDAFDPYNTGRFDRANTWKHRNRK